MKIRSMTATFGKLDRETIELNGGLNVFQAPNEWGKTTWCAFLRAMLYGPDEADRERYRPWSGKAMEGSIRLNWEERDITIRRRTRDGIPMGEFDAWETQSGQPVRELTAENCGRTLLGVKKEVFLRTGFLRSEDLPVRQDVPDLGVMDLGIGADGSGTADMLAGELSRLRMLCGDPDNGRIPACSAQIRRLRQQLEEYRCVSSRCELLRQQIREQESRRQQLENHRKRLQWDDARESQARLEEARRSARTAERLARELEVKYKELPSREELEAKIEQTSEEITELTFSLVQEPGEIWPGVVTGALAAVLLVVAVLRMDMQMLVPCLVLGIAAAVASVRFVARRQREWIWFRAEEARRRNRLDEREKLLRKWEKELQDLDDLDLVRQEVERSREQMCVIAAAMRSAEEPQPADPLPYDLSQTMERIGRLEQALAHDRRELESCRERLAALPAAEQLQTALEREELRLRELKDMMLALEHALHVLERAMQEQQTQFVCAIAQRTGQLIQRLTAGAYDRIVIDEDLTIRAAGSTEAVLRSARWRSEGTADQMYLALRIAAWERISPENPLILDDALIRFDPVRLERAMEVLAELSKERQILLFSCQERETHCLKR